MDEEEWKTKKHTITSRTHKKPKKRRPRFFKNSPPVHEIFFVLPSSLYFLPRRSIEEKQFSPSKKIFRERREKNCSQGTKRIHRRRKCSKNLFCHRLLSRQKHRCAAEYTNKNVENKKKTPAQRFRLSLCSLIYSLSILLLLLVAELKGHFLIIIFCWVWGSSSTFVLCKRNLSKTFNL